MKKHIVAFVERVTSTFIFAFIGVILATGSGVDVAALKAAAIAGGLSVAKYLYTLAGAYLSKPDPILTTAASEYETALLKHIDAVTSAITKATDVSGTAKAAVEPTPAPVPATA